jgi:hypothetical protein
MVAGDMLAMELSMGAVPEEPVRADRVSHVDSVAVELPQTFYGLLEAIRKRPGMYLGRKSLAMFKAWLDGYNYARCELRAIHTAEEAEFEAFDEFVCEKYDCGIRAVGRPKSRTITGMTQTSSTSSFGFWTNSERRDDRGDIPARSVDGLAPNSWSKAVRRRESSHSATCWPRCGAASSMPAGRAKSRG